MKILVLNSGSSSVKYQMFNMEDESVLAGGVAERIGIEDSILEHEYGEKEIEIKRDIKDHNEAIKLVIDTLISDKYGVINNMEEIGAVGHRVVHGGEKFANSIRITNSVIEQIREVSGLAPLHNPHNLTGIEVCSQLMPTTPQVAVFDTAFHQSMPRQAYMYGLPYEYYHKYGIRRYGFHGTSHQFVAGRAAELMDEDLEDLKIITCHLGNGASMTAVDGGRSIDTSMGLTPLEGLVMGTRSGDIDPAIIPFLMEKENLSGKEIDSILNKESGLKGVSGLSNDSRDVREAARAGNERAKVAHDLFNYRVKKYIGAYTAALGGVDAIVFTAGIGENAGEVRKAVMEDFTYLGIEIDDQANNTRREEIEISTANSEVKVFVIPTNEELVIARDTYSIVKD